MVENKLCFGCMENIGTVNVCPHCGYRKNTPYLPSSLAPGTKLNERYIIGKLTSHNGEGTTYIAYDTVISCKILIREYMPENLCSRVKGTPLISVNTNNLAQYKALMAEFTELNKQLARLRSSSHINPVLDIFAENNTTYAVFEYIDGVNLIEYLKENAGELSWEQVSKLFPPLFTSLNLVHNAGIIHRGISPETIFYTGKGELRLSGFCISPVRTANTELVSEVFKGYAAPEQYSLSKWQGTWTDIYGICAVLYRILTGCMPTDAVTRNSNDCLCAPHEINPNVPEKVSRVIMEGLELKSENRIHSITDFVTKVFDQSVIPEKKSAATTSTVSIPKQKLPLVQQQKRPPAAAATSRTKAPTPKSGKGTYDIIDDDARPMSMIERIKFPIIIGMLFLAILLVIAGISLKFIGGGDKNGKYQVNNSSSTGSTDVTTTQITTATTIATTSKQDVASVSGSGAKCQMIDITGMIYEDIIQSAAFTEDWITFNPVYEYNPSVPRGIIFFQSVAENEWFYSSNPVTIKISLGDGTIVVPSYKKSDINCYKLEEYTALLDELGIKYTTVPVVNYGYYSGYVIGVSPAPGENVNTKESDIVTVTYTNNPVTATTTTKAPPATTKPPATQATQAPPATSAPPQGHSQPENKPPAQPAA